MFDERTPNPMDDPCFFCTTETGRHPGCHAECERYTVSAAKKKARVPSERERDARSDAIGFYVESVNKTKRKNKIRK